jgi:hypothetical protein
LQTDPLESSLLRVLQQINVPLNKVTWAMKGDSVVADKTKERVH